MPVSTGTAKMVTLFILNGFYAPIIYLFDNQVGEFVGIVGLNREMLCEELTAALDRCAESITGVTTVDTVSDSLDNFIPAVGRDDIVNPTIRQYMNPVFEE